MSTSPRDDERREQEILDGDEVHADLQSPVVKQERVTLQERISDWLDTPLAILSLIWTVLIVAELALPLEPELTERILQVNWAIWGIFAMVFLVEFALAPRKTHYLRTHALAALSIVLPFARVVRVVRVLRFARLFRSVTLVRTILIANRATAAAAEVFSQHLFGYVLSIVVITTVLGAAGVFFFERDVPDTPFDTFWEALWWAATLITTVNVGSEPVTAEGRIVALLLRVIAAAVFGYITASIASFLINRRVAEQQPGAEERAAERDAIVHLAREVELLRAALERANLSANDTTQQSEPDDRPPGERAA